MSEHEFKSQISKVPHAGLNPFHLIPDINPSMSDLVTQQLPIYNQLSQKSKDKTYYKYCFLSVSLDDFHCAFT